MQTASKADRPGRTGYANIFIPRPQNCSRVSYSMGMDIALETIIPLLHQAAFGVLATQSTQLPGYPFASILPFVPDERHRPVFLISALAEHTKNLLADLRASFLVTSQDGKNVLTAARLTIIGDVMPVDASPELLARYLRYHPDARQYLELGDFAFFRLNPRRARYVAGFGQMGWVDEAEWANGLALPLADETNFYQMLIAALPMGIRLLGLDRYGTDIERQGGRERQQFPNAPLGMENIGEVIKRFLVAL